MSGNAHTPELEWKKRRQLTEFQKRMNKYGLRVRPTASVFSTSYPNSVMLVMETDEYPIRGHGAQLEQIRAEGYYVIKWQEIRHTKTRKRAPTVRRTFFRVQYIKMVKVLDESGVNL